MYVHSTDNPNSIVFWI